MNPTVRRELTRQARERADAKRGSLAHVRVAAMAVLKQLEGAHPREDIDLDAVRMVAAHVRDNA
jgi:ribosome recycling factor